MKMNLLYTKSETLGYGNMAINFAEELSRQNVEVYESLPKTYDETVCNIVCWMAIPPHARQWYRGQKASVFTMWEATHLPENMRANLKEFDKVLVPSTQNLELFSRYHSNVYQVPLGIDTDLWKPTKRKVGAFFDFLIAGSGARKGGDVAYKAFQKVFGNWHGSGPIPRLIFKSPAGVEYTGDNIMTISGYISRQDEIDLYANSHCYLAPSRGEGWGLQPLQAIAQGLPTILTDAHGQAEFAHLGLPIGYKMENAAYFSMGDAGQWWEPNLDDLCDQMVWVYDNYEMAKMLAFENSLVARANYSWKVATNRLLDVLDRDELDASYEGDTTIYKPTMELYPVILIKKWTAEIGGLTYQFEPGVTYYETSDIKRHLFDLKLLSPSCLESLDNSYKDMGLHPDQVSQIEAYRAEHAYCWTCGQRLNTLPTRFDDLLAEEDNHAIAQ